MASRSSKKQRRRETRRIFGEFERSLAARAVLGGREVVVRPSPQLKMSQVIFDFIEPYQESARSDAEFRNLVTLGLVAWNAALLPREERERTLDQIISKSVPDGAEEFRQIVHEMIERKLRCFAHIKRLIVAHELTFTEHGPYLFVSSTLT